MHDGSFQKIDETDDTIIGPKVVLVCGFATEIEAKLTSFLGELELTEHRVLFCLKQLVKLPLADALGGAVTGELAAPGDLPRVMVLSGMTGGQLQAFVSGYRTTGLPRPIFAAVTEANLEFPVGKLIMELLREQRAMSRR